MVLFFFLWVLFLIALALVVGGIGFACAGLLAFPRAAKRDSGEDDATERRPAPGGLLVAIVIAILTLYIVIWLLWQAKDIGSLQGGGI